MKIENMKNTPSKVANFTLIDFFQYCLKRSGQLKTHIAFSIFSILGTNLPQTVIYPKLKIVNMNSPFKD